MMRVFLSFLAVFCGLAGLAAAQQGPLSGPAIGPAPAGQMAPARSMPVSGCGDVQEADCILEAAMMAASRLSGDKQVRLRPAFAELIAQSADPALGARWQQRIGQVKPRSPSPDYARETAQSVIAAQGWQGFMQRARAGAEPLNIGRPEIMGAALELAPDAGARRELTELMFSLAGSPTATSRAPRGFHPDMFERADFGHVLAERMMRACDAGNFARARRLTSAPDSIRYDFWQARISGNAGSLAAKVRMGDGSDDTSFIRQALEGYGAIMRYGYCAR